MSRNYFTIHKVFYDLLKLLKPTVRLKMFEAIFDYGFDGTLPDFGDDDMASTIWQTIQERLSSDKKRYENGCKGGAPTGNSNAKKQPKNNQETTEKQPKNNLKTTNGCEKEEKEKEKENSPIKENPPTPLKENIFPQEIKEKVKEEKEITPHRACARVEQIAFEERYRRFIDEHKWINEDYCGHYLLEIDFDLLSEEIERSSVLKQQTSLAWIARQWLRIKGGYYRDFEKPKRESGMDILAKLHEKYKREEENETFQNSGIFGDN